ncbi:MAG: SOS response-associated peptidase [Planctomycetes bacterium]|nr:SOS response-associated peptidase [Planctomycetota bacterium]
MCGRFTLISPGEVLAEFFELVDTPTVLPRYNIAPTQAVGVVRHDCDIRRFDLMHWGLIPSWAKDPTIGNRMINARSETAATKPSFRSAVKYRRCLLPTDGFYEWKAIAGQKRKQPYYIRMADGQPFAFAGLWEHWEGPDGAAVDSCTILTTEPNEMMADIHNRMPVILDPKDFAQWLDPSVQAADVLCPLLRSFPPGGMKAIPVNTTVNRPSNDTAACIEPLDVDS